MKLIISLKSKLTNLENRIIPLINRTRETVSLIIIEIFAEKNRYYFAAVSFVPFAGWLIPLYLKRDDEYAQTQGKIGFYMAFFFTTIITLFFLINLFASKDLRVFRLIMVIFIYLLHLTYFSLCGYGIYLTLHQKKFDLILKIPYVDRFTSLIEL
jgi:hypothetical protein